MDKDAADFFKTSYDEFIADGGKVDGIVDWIGEPAEAEKVRLDCFCPMNTSAHTDVQRTRSEGAVAAAEFPASSLWPYKLVTALLQLCIEKHGLNLQTNTPARAVERSGDKWVIKTDRGDLTTDKVVYCTNAFTATLLPEFLGRIMPFRGQCSAVVPTKPFSGPNILTHTMSHRYGIVRLLLSHFKHS